MNYRNVFFTNCLLLLPLRTKASACLRFIKCIKIMEEIKFHKKFFRESKLGNNFISSTRKKTQKTTSNKI
uniref:Secreted protein n=1 Tax=Octopus bimaculoides TaxID=37653 RepID=A0A0L8FF48_OCTBM